MSTATRRRPLPALAFLLALSILTGIVWWRVLHRAEPAGTAQPPAPSQSVHCSPGTRGVKLPAPSAVTVTVLNGAGRDQLATRTSNQLKGRGFKTGTPGTTSALAGVAEIRYGSTGKAGATLLSYYLPGARLVPASRKDAKLELVLGSGFTSLASDASVKQAVARAGKPC